MTRIRRGPKFTSRLVKSTSDGEPTHVVDDLRAAILSGDQPPGTPIPVDQVSQFFGVSQIPVREALMTLIGEGLVEHVPHIGYSVAKLTFAEFRELYDVREALEVSALSAAVSHATADDDRAVHAAYVSLTDAVSSGDQRAFAIESRRFHVALLESSHMDRLVWMYEAAWNLTEPARPMSRVSVDSRVALHGEHADILEAFITRDADGLIARTREHYAHLREAIEGLRDDPDFFRAANT